MAKNFDLDKIILSETRVTQRHTQESLSREIEISREAYNRIERSGSTSKRTAQKLAKALGVSIDYLTGLDRGNLLYSSFYCEFIESGVPSQQARRQLFNTELDLLAFLDQRISEERPIRIGGRSAEEYSDFPTTSLPTYSIEGVDCMLTIPLREEIPDPESNAGRTLTFTFRELQHQAKVGLTWKPLTKWASIHINQTLIRTLNRYYPEYIFQGEHKGSSAQFRIVLSDDIQQAQCAEILLEDLWTVRQFSNWFRHGLPPVTVYKTPEDNSLSFEIFPQDGSSPSKRLDVIRVDPETKTEVPFPAVWQEAVLSAFSWNEKKNKSGGKTNLAIPTLEAFSKATTI
ncbi:MAG: helix-turn-helix transcriptional regulator [Marinobacter sp.]